MLTLIKKIPRAAFFQLKSIKRRVTFLRLKRAFKIANSPSNFFRRRKLAKAFMTNSKEPKEVLELKKRGIVKSTKYNDKEIINELKEEVDSRIESLSKLESVGTSKNFWKQLLTEDDLVSTSPFVRYLLQPSILSLIIPYFGTTPYLSSLSLFVSKPEDSKDWEKSQLWHKDYNDSKVLKLWTYFNDVLDDVNGPFTLIPAHKANKLRLPRFPTHKKDSVMEKQGSEKYKEKIYGEALSSFLVDTFRCWHLGSRVGKGGLRAGLVATYITNTSFFDYDNKIKVVSDLPDLEKAILSKQIDTKEIK